MVWGMSDASSLVYAEKGKQEKEIKFMNHRFACTYWKWNGLGNQIYES